MSYIDDTCDGLLDKGLRIVLYGSDYDIDSERLEEDIVYYPDNTDCDHISCWDRDQSEQDVDGFID